MGSEADSCGQGHLYTSINSTVASQVCLLRQVGAVVQMCLEAVQRKEKTLGLSYNFLQMATCLFHISSVAAAWKSSMCLKRFNLAA